jgi:hypothetical protein
MRRKIYPEPPGLSKTAAVQETTHPADCLSQGKIRRKQIRYFANGKILSFKIEQAAYRPQD